MLETCMFWSHLVQSDPVWNHRLVSPYLTNTLSSYCFQSHILHPTRITSHSASLIDNIFFNSLEYTTYSVNIVEIL